MRSKFKTFDSLRAVIPSLQPSPMCYTGSSSSSTKICASTKRSQIQYCGLSPTLPHENIDSN
eukprot:2696127-Rhodomonas_salina.4